MKNVVALVVALSLPALAGELNGVKMPDTVTVEGKELKLNGMGLRKKMIFKVYVAGLYVENKSKDGAAILAADGVRRVDMAMLRDLERSKITEAIQSAFSKNAGDKMGALQERLTKFMAVIPDLKEGQTLTLVYVPGKGTHVEGVKETFHAEGKDFADALFSVWLGKFPVDEDLQKGMLGNN